MKGGYCRSSRGRKERAVVLVVVIMNVVRAGALLSHNNSCARAIAAEMECSAVKVWPVVAGAHGRVKTLPYLRSNACLQSCFMTCSYQEPLALLIPALPLDAPSQPIKHLAPQLLRRWPAL